MKRVIKISYSASSNISFNNDYDPIYLSLPDDWDDLPEDKQSAYIDSEVEQTLWELVDIYGEVTEVDDDVETEW